MTLSSVCLVFLGCITLPLVISVGIAAYLLKLLNDEYE